MILSFHPNIVADENILCAGRLPDEKDEAIIRKAEAIILPQGCSEDLYRMCRKHCLHIFPNYDVRFDFPRKLGQARLFQEIRAPFPVTYLFDSVYSFRFDYPRSSPLEFPYVFKSDWGGEGDEVFLLETNNSLERCLKRAKDMERGGRKGLTPRICSDRGKGFACCRHRWPALQLLAFSTKQLPVSYKRQGGWSNRLLVCPWASGKGQGNGRRVLFEDRD